MKSFIGLILGVVGAIGSILVSILLFILYFMVRFGKTALASQTLIDFASKLSFWLLVLAVWLLLFGVLGIIFSSMMNKPGKVRKGGDWLFDFGYFKFESVFDYWRYYGDL